MSDIRKKLDKNFDLKGKTALITGSSQGIGQGIALAMAEYGADVILHYRHGHDKAKRVLKQIKELGVHGSVIRADLSKTGSVAAMEKQLNADAKPWEQITQADFDAQMQVNVKSTMLLMQRFPPR